MARDPAKSLPAAEQRALTGENDSQDSQEKLLFLIREHGIGVVSGDHVHAHHLALPVLANDGPLMAFVFSTLDHQLTKPRRWASTVISRYESNVESH